MNSKAAIGPRRPESDVALLRRQYARIRMLAQDAYPTEQRRGPMLQAALKIIRQLDVMPHLLLVDVTSAFHDYRRKGWLTVPTKESVRPDYSSELLTQFVLIVWLSKSHLVHHHNRNDWVMHHVALATSAHSDAGLSNAAIHTPTPRVARERDWVVNRIYQRLAMALIGWAFGETSRPDKAAVMFCVQTNGEESKEAKDLLIENVTDMRQISRLLERCDHIKTLQLARPDGDYETVPDYAEVLGAGYTHWYVLKTQSRSRLLVGVLACDASQSKALGQPDPNKLDEVYEHGARRERIAALLRLASPRGDSTQDEDQHESTSLDILVSMVRRASRLISTVALLVPDTTMSPPTQLRVLAQSSEPFVKLFDPSTRVALGHSVSGFVYENQQPLVIRQTLSMVADVRIALQHVEHTQACAGYPCKCGDKTYGVLYTAVSEHSLEVDRPFDQSKVYQPHTLSLLHIASMIAGEILAEREAREHTVRAMARQITHVRIQAGERRVAEDLLLEWVKPLFARKPSVRSSGSYYVLLINVDVPLERGERFSDADSYNTWFVSEVQQWIRNMARAKSREQVVMCYWNKRGTEIALLPKTPDALPYDDARRIMDDLTKIANRFPADWDKPDEVTSEFKAGSRPNVRCWVKRIELDQNLAAEAISVVPGMSQEDKLSECVASLMDQLQLGMNQIASLCEGHLAENQSRFGDAASHYRAAWTACQSARRLDSYVLRHYARSLLFNKEYDLAAQHFEQLGRLDPSAPAIEWQAICLLLQGKLSEARKLRSLFKEPNSAQVPISLHDYLASDGDLDAAMKALLTATPLHGPDADLQAALWRIDMCLLAYISARDESIRLRCLKRFTDETLDAFRRWPRSHVVQRKLVQSSLLQREVV